MRQRTAMGRAPHRGTVPKMDSLRGARLRRRFRPLPPNPSPAGPGQLLCHRQLARTAAFRGGNLSMPIRTPHVQQPAAEVHVRLLERDHLPLPAAVAGLNRSIDFLRGKTLVAGGHSFPSHAEIKLRSDAEVPLENGPEEAEVLPLPGAPHQGARRVVQPLRYDDAQRDRTGLPRLPAHAGRGRATRRCTCATQAASQSTPTGASKESSDRFAKISFLAVSAPGPGSGRASRWSPSPADPAAASARPRR